MKITYYLITLVAVFSNITACNKSNDDLASNTSQVAVNGTWRVSLFTDSGNNETTDFAGYTFTFGNNGVLTAVKSGATQTGTWSTSSSSNKFNIDLGPKTNKPLGELTDDWKILSSTDKEIRLGDDNSSSNEFLTFTKN